VHRNKKSDPTETEKQQTFKGLWGKTDYINESTNEYNDIITETEHYFPFLDETQEEIDKIKSKYPLFHSGYWTSAYPEYCYEQTTNLLIKSVLPFTKSEWAQYLKNKSSLKKTTRILIEETLKRFDLKKIK
jgi:hypothetical protein